LKIIRKSIIPEKGDHENELWDKLKEEIEPSLEIKRIASPLTKTPIIICNTPMITDIFILRLSMKFKLLAATLQTGSRPKG
jgi:hypothetical protein